TVGDSIGLHLEATAGALGVEEFIVESGLAGPRLSDDRDHLTLPVAGPLKRPSDRIHLVLAPHEPSESSARGSLKALARRLGIDQLKHIYGLSETPDRYEPQRLEVELALGQPGKRFSGQNGSGRGQLFHPRSEVRGLADRAVFHREVVAYASHHDLA